MEEVVWEKFRRTLDENHQWPCSFTYKFIVPRPQLGHLLFLFGNRAVHTKDSNGGRFVSVTSIQLVQSGAEVVELYRAASRIEGVIAL